jgi:Cellulase (glycosyl hydrolase family 5)
MRRLAAVTVATLIGVAAAVGISPTAAQAVSVRVQPEFFGIHDFKEDAPLPYGAVRLWDGHTTWADIEPLRDEYHFRHLDALVKTALARNAKITLVLGSTPAWAATDPRSSGANWLPLGASSPPLDLADWANYVRTVATRYQGRIGSYQIWNEATTPPFWNGTMTQLAQVTAVAYTAIKAVDPQAQIVATPLLRRQVNWVGRSTEYLTALRDAGWPVDVFAMHSYQASTMANPDGRASVIRQIEAVLASVKAPPKPLWDTEANYSAEAYTAHKITGKKAAAWVARSYLDSLRLGIARSYWYAWDTPTLKLGITVGPRTQAAHGYTSVRRWLVGSDFRGCTSSRARTGAKVTSCSFLRGTKASRVLWASANVGTRLPGKGKTICRLLSGCAPRTASTKVTTSPVLVR